MNNKKSKAGSNDNVKKVLSFIFLHFTFFVYSLAAVFSKMAGSQQTINKKFILCYAMVLLILMVYAVLWQQNLKRMNLVTAYSNKAVTVVWGMIWGVLIYNDQVTWNRVLGAVIIMIGVCLMASEGGEE